MLIGRELALPLLLIERCLGCINCLHWDWGLYTNNSGKVSKKKIKKYVGFIHPYWLAGVSRGPKSNPKKIVFKEKYEDDQNGLIHPEN